MYLTQISVLLGAIFLWWKRKRGGETGGDSRSDFLGHNSPRCAWSILHDPNAINLLYYTLHHKIYLLIVITQYLGVCEPTINSHWEQYRIEVEGSRSSDVPCSLIIHELLLVWGFPFRLSTSVAVVYSTWSQCDKPIILYTFHPKIYLLIVIMQYLGVCEPTINSHWEQMQLFTVTVQPAGQHRTVALTSHAY